MSATAPQPHPVQHASRKAARPLSVAVPLFFVALPAILFYTITFRNLLNIPFCDDYDALLDFLNHFVTLNTISAKAAYLLAAQHNEYKLLFGNSVALLQLALFGHIDFRILSVIGDGFIFLLAILLWKMFIPDCKDLATRLALFIPISWLLFQLEYWETLNWPMASLQNTSILFFSFATIYLLNKGSRPAFWAALIFFVIAVAASGNGFLLIPVAMLILILNRQYLRIVPWLFASAACIAFYAYRYNINSSQVHQHHSIFSTFHPLAPAYVVAFIGSAAGLPFRILSLVLGTLLCVFFIWIGRRGYMRRNPLVSYCLLFLLLTAIGVAGLRSEFGLSQALSSRYTVYSALFIALAWFAIVEEFLPHSTGPLRLNLPFMAATLLSISFSLYMDSIGAAGLKERDNGMIQAMTAFEHQMTSGTTIWPAPLLVLPNPIEATNTFNQRIRPILNESIKLGVYRPPPL